MGELAVDDPNETRRNYSTPYSMAVAHGVATLDPARESRILGRYSLLASRSLNDISRHDLKLSAFAPNDDTPTIGENRDITGWRSWETIAKASKN